jgi:hypothetical protein
MGGYLALRKKMAGWCEAPLMRDKYPLLPAIRNLIGTERYGFEAQKAVGTLTKSYVDHKPRHVRALCVAWISFGAHGIHWTDLQTWDDIPEDAIHSAWDVDKSHSWGREGTMVQLEREDDAYLFTISTGDSIDQWKASDSLIKSIKAKRSIRLLSRKRQSQSTSHQNHTTP